MKIDITIVAIYDKEAFVLLHEVVEYEFAVNSTVYLPYAEVHVDDLDKYVEADEGTRLTVRVSADWLAENSIC